VKYMCKCEGDACPQSYCASSQCQGDTSAAFSCDLPCSPQEYDVQCPAGKIPRFVKSFPTCPEHTPRYACKHFDRCEAGEGQRVSLSAGRRPPAPPTFARTGDRRDKSSSARARPTVALLALPLLALLAASR
jgi:hypothetical protein